MPNFHPSYAKVNLVCGCIILLPVILTIIKVYRGSKLTFCYTLLAFSFGFTLMYFEAWSSFTYGYNYVKIHEGFNTPYIWLSLQGWFFAMKYLESAN